VHILYPLRPTWWRWAGKRAASSPRCCLC